MEIVNDYLALQEVKFFIKYWYLIVFIAALPIIIGLVKRGLKGEDN